MQIDQETLNSLFKELVALDSLGAKDSDELTDQYEYYEMAEKKFVKMFNNKQISSENEVKQNILRSRLIHRFIARLSEAYQVLLAKKSIHRSKASTFQPTIYGCLSNMYDGKQGVFVQLITSIFVECRLQIEIANRKLTNNDIVKRVNEEEEKPLSISQLLLQKRNTQPEWQININNNKNLSQYFKKAHGKIYDLLGIDKYQEDQFLYFQSREQNMDRLFQQLMAQNVHIKKSLSWAADLDLGEFHEQIQQVKCIVTSFTPMQIIKTDQLDGQKTVCSFFSPNEQQFKIRSYSQNAKTKDIYSFSEKINIFHPNYQEQIKYKMSKSKIEQRNKKPPITNMLTRKALFDPQNAKKKTKSFRFKS